MVQFIMRMDSREKAHEDFEKKQIKFGCPANWCNLADKKQSNSIGDQLECIFAHIAHDDTRLHEILKLGDSVRMLEDDTDRTYFLQYTPILLTPALCFFQIEFDPAEVTPKMLSLEQYSSSMGKSLSDVSFLVINNAKTFEKDLRENVPVAIQKYANRLITDGSGKFVQPFDIDNPINYNSVDYKHDRSELFFEDLPSHCEMWRKSKQYFWQREGRVTIPHVYFKQELLDVKTYNHKDNELYVDLPALSSYAEVVDGDTCNTIIFYNDDGVIKYYQTFV